MSESAAQGELDSAPVDLVAEAHDLLRLVHEAAETEQVDVQAHWVEHRRTWAEGRVQVARYECAVYTLTDPQTGEERTVMNRWAQDGVSAHEWATGTLTVRQVRFPAPGRDVISGMVPHYDDWVRPEYTFQRTMSIHADMLYGDHAQAVAQRYDNQGKPTETVEMADVNLLALNTLTAEYCSPRQPVPLQ